MLSGGFSFLSFLGVLIQGEIYELAWMVGYGETPLEFCFPPVAYGMHIVSHLRDVSWVVIGSLWLVLLRPWLNSMHLIDLFLCFLQRLVLSDFDWRVIQFEIIMNHLPLVST